MPSPEVLKQKDLIREINCPVKMEQEQTAFFGSLEKEYAGITQIKKGAEEVILSR